MWVCIRPMLRPRVLSILSVFWFGWLVLFFCHWALSQALLFFLVCFILRPGLAELPECTQTCQPSCAVSLVAGIPGVSHHMCKVLFDIWAYRGVFAAFLVLEEKVKSLPRLFLLIPFIFFPCDQRSTQLLCQGILSSMSPLLKSLTCPSSLIEPKRDASRQMSSSLGYGCGCKSTHLFKIHMAEVCVHQTAAGCLQSGLPWILSTHTTGAFSPGGFACLMWLLLTRPCSWCEYLEINKPVQMIG